MQRCECFNFDVRMCDLYSSITIKCARFGETHMKVMGNMSCILPSQHGACKVFKFMPSVNSLVLNIFPLIARSFVNNMQK